MRRPAWAGAWGWAGRVVASAWALLRGGWVVGSVEAAAGSWRGVKKPLTTRRSGPARSAGAAWGRGPVALLASVLLALGAPAQEMTLIDDAALELTAEWAGPAPASMGFTPVTLRGRNDTDTPVTWEVTAAPGFRMGQQPALTTMVRLTVPAHATREQVWLVPVAQAGIAPSAGWEPGPSLSVAGPGRALMSGALQATARNDAMPPWAVSPRLEAGVRQRLAAEITGDPSLAVIEPATLPADWRAWSSFAQVWLTHAEWTGLDAERRGSLRDWAAWGGRIVIFECPAADVGEERIGAGWVGRRRGSPQEIDASDYALLAAPHQPGLPSAHETVPPMVDTWTAGTANAGWVALVLIVTTLLIGPVNFFLLAPAGRRHRLFLTTPLIAVGAAVVLAVIILVADGTGGEGRRAALVLVLPYRARALVHQEQTTRTGLLLGRSFPVPDDTLLALAEARRGRQSVLGGVALTRQDGIASGDWFRDRAVQAQVLRRLTPTRARLEQVATAADDAPVVVSSFAAELRDLQYRDAAGRRWEAPVLAPGQRVTLRRHPRGDGASFGATLRPPEASPAWVRTADELDTLRRWWVAQATTVPDLAPLPTLESIRWTDDLVVLTGSIFGGPGGNGPDPADVDVDAGVEAADGQGTGVAAPVSGSPEAPAPAGEVRP